MPNNGRPFNSAFLSSKHRKSGPDNLQDAIKFVGRKYCLPNGKNGGEGVFIYGLASNRVVTVADYHIVTLGEPPDDYKRFYIIINTLPFHLCFCILHVNAKKWKKTFFADFLNLGTITFENVGDRRRSPTIVKFVEQCVARLTKGDQKRLSRLHKDLTEEDKLRVVYLVLKHGWNYVLQPDFMTNDLPRIRKMTVVEFKTEHVVHVDLIIERSTSLYEQYFDELENRRTFFEQQADAVGEWVAPVASEENSSDDDDDGDNNMYNDDGERIPGVPDNSPSRDLEKLDEDSTVLSISSPTNNRTDKRKHRENNNGDDDGVDNNNSNTNNNDTARRSYMENQPERSASLRDEEKQKKKKTKKKKKKKTKKKKKKTSNDDSDDENGFADDDSNNNNKKSFRPENDHSESDKDEISDAGDTDFAFGDAISMNERGSKDNNSVRRKPIELRETRLIDSLLAEHSEGSLPLSDSYDDDFLADMDDAGSFDGGSRTNDMGDDKYTGGGSEPVTKCVGTSVDPLVLTPFDRTKMINDPQYTLSEAIINDNANDSNNMNGATAAAATYKAWAEELVPDFTVGKKDASNGRITNRSTHNTLSNNDNNNNINPVVAKILKKAGTEAAASSSSSSTAALETTASTTGFLSATKQLATRTTELTKIPSMIYIPTKADVTTQEPVTSTGAEATMKKTAPTTALMNEQVEQKSPNDEDELKEYRKALRIRIIARTLAKQSVEGRTGGQQTDSGNTGQVEQKSPNDEDELKEYRKALRIRIIARTLAKQSN